MNINSARSFLSGFRRPLRDVRPPGLIHAVLARPSEKPPRTRKPKEVLEAGHIAERERVDYDKVVKRLVKITKAPSIPILREGLEPILDRHPPGLLPVLYFELGVYCAGHGGQLKTAIAYRYGAGKSAIRLNLGLECVARLNIQLERIATTPAVLRATNEYVLAERQLKHWEERRLAAPRDTEVTQKLLEVYARMNTAREDLKKAWELGSEQQIISYNEAAFLKEGPRLRDALETVRTRLGRVMDEDATAVLTVHTLGKKLDEVVAYAEGIRKDRNYLDEAAVAAFHTIFDRIVERCPSLQIWPSLDSAMRTFEHYVPMTGDAPPRVAEFLEGDDLAFVRQCMTRWRSEVNNTGRETLRRPDLKRLREIFERFESNGCLTRDGWLKREPRLASDMRLVREYLAWLPEDLEGEEDFLRKMLTIFGRHEVIRADLPVPKPERKIGPLTKPGGGRGRAISAGEAGVDTSGAQLKGEKVRRVFKTDAERFAHVVGLLRTNFRTRDEILAEFSEIETWIAKLKKMGPAFVDAKQAKQKAKAEYELLTTADERLLIQRGITHWENLDRGQRFPRHVAQAFREASGRRPTHAIRYSAIEGFEATVDRLRFRAGKDVRQLWVGMVTKNRAGWGDAVAAAFAPLKTMAQGKLDRLVLEQIEQFRAFELALNKRFWTLAQLREHEPAIAAGLELVVAERERTRRREIAAGFTPTESEAVLFLRERDYFDPALLDKWKALRFVASGAPGTLNPATLAVDTRAALAKFEGMDLPLGPGLRADVDRALIYADTRGALTGDQADLLARVGQGTMPVLFASYYQGGGFSDPARRQTCEAIIANHASEAERAEIARSLKEHLQGDDFQFGAAAEMLVNVRRAMTNPDLRDEALVSDPIAVSHLRRYLGNIRFGRPAGLLPRRVTNAQALEGIGLIAPRDFPFRVAVSTAIAQAMGDAFYKGEGETRVLEDAVRQAALQTAKNLLRDDQKGWGSVIFKALSDGVKSTERRVLSIGCEWALRELRRR